MNKRLLTQPGDSLPVLNEGLIDFLMEGSETFGKEQELQRAVRKFLKLQKERFGLQRAKLMQLKLEDELRWQEVFDVLQQFKNIEAQIVTELTALVLPQKPLSQEARGVHLIQCRHRDFLYVVIGDCVHHCYVLFWELAPEQMRDRHVLLYQDFFARQLQFVCSWLARFDKTQELLYQDDLTGLYNSRYIDVTLENEVRRVHRFRSTFSLLFIDLDNFKKINDTHGHLAGSSVLKQVALVLRKALREVDSVARYGGDEFILLLLGANSETGFLAAERIRKLIAETEYSVEGDIKLSVTASIGVATCPEHAETKDELIALADETMYEGKRAGRNQVVIVNRETLAVKSAEQTNAL